MTPPAITTFTPPALVAEPVTMAPESGSPAPESVKRKPANMFKPGHPKFAGRKAGSKNRRTRAAQEMAVQMGVDPVRFMLECIRSDSMQVVKINPVSGKPVLDDKGDPVREWVAIPMDMKADMAKAVAPFVHAKLVATQVTGKDEGPLAIMPVDLNAILADPAMADAAQTLALALAQQHADQPEVEPGEMPALDAPEDAGD